MTDRDSVSSGVTSTNRIMPGKYFKLLDNLTIPETQTMLKKLGLDYEKSTRRNLLKRLFIARPDLRTEENKNMRCNFHAYQDQNGRIRIRYAVDAEETEYNELRVTPGQRADLVGIIREIIAEEAPESEDDDFMPDEDDLEENISEEATTVIERRPKGMTLKNIWKYIQPNSALTGIPVQPIAENQIPKPKAAPVPTPRISRVQEPLSRSQSMTSIPSRNSSFGSYPKMPFQRLNEPGQKTEPDFGNHENVGPETKFDFNALTQCIGAMTNMLQQSQSMEQERRTSKIFNLNPKHIKYDEDEGIGRFLTNIEAYAAGNGVVADLDKIRIACTCLATSSKGADRLGLLNSEDRLDWTKFKTKLFMMESQSARSFEIKFYNYQRKPGQPCALLMSKLIDFYRKSRGYESNQELNDTEIYIIKRRFMDCLEPTLAKLLEDKLSDAQYRKEDMSKLDILASRTMQLEETFRIGIHQPKSNANNIQQLFNISEPSIQSKSEISTLIESINNIKSDITQLSSDVKQTKSQIDKNIDNRAHFKRRNNHRFRSRDRSNSRKIDYGPADGFCIKYIRGQCERSATDCKFKHSQAPKQVLEYVQKFI